jgi:hypothetical protein
MKSTHFERRILTSRQKASQNKFDNMNSQPEYIASEIDDNELSEADLENVAGGYAGGYGGGYRGGYGGGYSGGFGSSYTPPAPPPYKPPNGSLVMPPPPTYNVRR